MGEDRVSDMLVSPSIDFSFFEEDLAHIGFLKGENACGAGFCSMERGGYVIPGSWEGIECQTCWYQALYVVCF